MLVDTKLYASSTLKSWTPLIELQGFDRCALATYHSQLVLVGGYIYVNEEGTTNKLWTSSPNTINFQPSLPPMPTARRSSSVINTGGLESEECLIVVGGTGRNLRFATAVEILFKNQWFILQSLPIRHEPIWHKPIRDDYLSLALQDGKLYCGAPYTIFYCSLNISGTQPSTSVWCKCVDLSKKNKTLGPVTVSFAQRLLNIGTEILAYNPITQSMDYVGKHPMSDYEPFQITKHPNMLPNVLLATILPSGSLMIVSYVWCHVSKTSSSTITVGSKLIIHQTLLKGNHSIDTM